MAHRLLEGLDWITGALRSLSANCIHGIDVDRRHLAATSARSVGVVTALVPYLGYATAARIARAALAGEGEVRDLVLSTGALSGDEVDALLVPDHLTGIATLEAPTRVRRVDLPVSAEGEGR